MIALNLSNNPSRVGLRLPVLYSSKELKTLHDALLE